MNNTDWLSIAKRLQALAQAGLAYSQSGYDLERYQEISEISVDILHRLTEEPIEKIAPLFTERFGYQTPKSDIRAVIFNDDHKILMVKEKIDGRWALPGGWADIGHTPSEVAVKEVMEETGLEVTVERLLAVLDKKCHPHPPEPWYVYKFFVLCKKTGGEISRETNETSEIAYFGLEELPPLSEVRNTFSQLELMFEFHKNPAKEVILD